MEDIIYYRLGEPEIGRIHAVFRDLTTLRDFISGLPERNLVDIYQLTGTVVEDEGTPDGLYIKVLDYKQFHFN